MYHQSKTTSRHMVVSKEVSMFGPQFSVQASSTGYTERPPKGFQQNMSLLQNTNPSNQRDTPHMKVFDAGLITNPPPHQNIMQNSDNNSFISSQNSDRLDSYERTSNLNGSEICRTADERAANPDRLNLDRHGLKACPVLEGEDKIRLLNYQHNFITKIENVSSLRRLIFLDLYDNQIEYITGLSSLKSLRVLMLGKNKIRRIQYLENLTKLDVLDLHGNQIQRIENLNHLSELRVLNLAGNLIERIENMTGLESLTELNLRRNRISTITRIERLVNLERLFLSYNEINCFSDVSCLGSSNSILEMTMDGNPIAQDSHYRQVILRNMLSLRQLDSKRISDEERRISLIMAKKEDEKKREINKIALMKERRQVAISNVKHHWEVSQASVMTRTNKLLHSDGYVANHVGTVANHVGTVSNVDLNPGDHVINDPLQSSGGLRSLSAQCGSLVSIASEKSIVRPGSAKSTQSEQEWSGTNSRVLSANATRSATLIRPGNTENGTREKITLSGPVEGITLSHVDHLAELDNDTLNLYGNGSLNSIEKNWGHAAPGSVTNINFNFIDFDEITKFIHKIKARFPSLNTIHFNSTNIESLNQFNALAALRRLDNIYIEPNGNPITNLPLWRYYLFFRLVHLGLKKVNNEEITAPDIVKAESLFGPLAQITSSQLPQSRLVSLLGESKKKQILNSGDEKLKIPEGRQTSTKPSSESVGRSGLTYSCADMCQSKAEESKVRKKFVHSYLEDLTKNAIEIEQKQKVFKQIWPAIFKQLVENAVYEMLDTNTYMKKCMDDFLSEKN